MVLIEQIHGAEVEQQHRNEVTLTTQIPHRPVLASLKR